MAQNYIYDLFKEILIRIITEVKENGGSDEKMQDILHQKADIFRDLVEEISNDSVECIESIMYEKVLKERAYTAEFIAKQEQLWGKAFVASEALYICILESTEQYMEYANDVYKDKESYMYIALKNIHARALQIYSEILCLNKNGFADGAYARWRSLYELNIISAFIVKYGEEVAKSFINSATTDDSNEWARSAECFKNHKRKYISFSDIQSKCEVASEAWKREYKFVNKLVHASSQGTMYRLGGDTSVALPVGQTDYGMGISAIHSSISLLQITMNFFNVFPNEDTLFAIVTFRKFVEKIAVYYKEIEDNCFDNDR